MSSCILGELKNLMKWFEAADALYCVAKLKFTYPYVCAVTKYRLSVVQPILMGNVDCKWWAHKEADKVAWKCDITKVQ